MRCPHCGAENADHTRICRSCGGDLTTSQADREVEELMSELPTVVAERAAEQETRLLAEREERRRAEVSEDLDEPALDDEYDEDSERTQLAPTPTMVRPRPDAASVPLVDEEHFVVRNTRDYDHDAQSTNTVRDPQNFATLHERQSSRELRRDPYARSKRRGTVPGEGNSRSKLRPFLAILLVAAVLGGGAAVVTYGMELWGGRAVPYVLGSSQGNAEEKLAEKGLVARVEAEPADDAIGKVLAQDPEAGTRVPEGSEVTLTVATNRTIPEVVGMSEQEARDVLAKAGAERVKTQTRPSTEAEGTVIAVSPEAGAPFVSRSEIVLTVAGPYRVPDVIGQKETDAVDALKDAGLSADVSYVTSDKTVRTVVETSPAAGEIIAEGGTVSVKVSSPYPTSVLHVAEYFSHSSQDIDTYLQKEGLKFEDGIIDTLGNAVALYTSSEKGKVTFSSQPHKRSFSLPKEGTSNVLATGAPIAGVRLDLPSSEVVGTASRETVEAVAGNCSLGELKDFCDNTTIKLPAGTKQITATFACGSGETDDLVWTVLVVSNGGSTRAAVTCAKKSLYGSSDLAQFGGSACQYAAYEEVYLSSEYQVQEKKDDKKDEKKDDKKDEKSDKNASESSDKSDSHESDTHASDNAGQQGGGAPAPEENVNSLIGDAFGGVNGDD